MGHVVRMEGGALYTCFSWEKTMERDYLENLGADGRRVTNGSLKNPLEWRGLHSCGPRQEQEDKNVQIL